METETEGAEIRLRKRSVNRGHGAGLAASAASTALELEKQRVGELLRSKLKALGVKSKELLAKDLAKNSGLTASRFSNYVRGRRLPDTSMRKVLADLLEMSESEREALLRGGEWGRSLATLSVVRAVELKIASFTDIRALYFAKDRIPKKVFVFSAGPPLALDYEYISEWLLDFLAEEGRELYYVFPPDVGEACVAQLRDRLDGLFAVKDLRSPLFGVISWHTVFIRRDSPSSKTRPGRRTANQKKADTEQQHFDQHAAQHSSFMRNYGTPKIAPRLFWSFDIGPSIFHLEPQDGSLVSFTTFPVGREEQERITNLCGLSKPHPPHLWVELSGDRKAIVKTDVDLLLKLRSNWTEKVSVKKVNEIVIAKILDG